MVNSFPASTFYRKIFQILQSEGRGEEKRKKRGEEDGEREREREREWRGWTEKLPQVLGTLYYHSAS